MTLPGRSRSRRAGRSPTSRASSPPRASSVRNRSCRTLANGIGTRSDSAAASVSRMSLCPNGAAKPAGSNSWSAISRAVCPVHRRVEERGGQDVEVAATIDAGLRDERHRLAQRLDHRGDQEIAAQLDQVRRVGLFADVERFLPDHFEQRRARRDRIVRARCDDEQLRGGCRFRAPEDRCGDEALPSLPVRLRESFAIARR